MKDSLQKYKQNYPEIKQTDRFMFRCGFNEIEINADEYCYVDSLLRAMQSGEVNRNAIYRCKRTGESFALSNFQYLTRKKSSEKKIFGEDLKL